MAGGNSTTFPFSFLKRRMYAKGRDSVSSSLLTAAPSPQTKLGREFFSPIFKGGGEGAAVHRLCGETSFKKETSTEKDKQRTVRKQLEVSLALRFWGDIGRKLSLSRRFFLREKTNDYVQSNSVNKDSVGAIESVRINGLSILSGFGL